MSTFLGLMVLAVVVVAAAGASDKIENECGGELTAPTGSIVYERTSNKHKLPAGKMCRWIIKVPEATSITITFDWMFLSKSGKSCHQLMVITNDEGNDKDLVENSGKFRYMVCAKRQDPPPPPIEVPGNTTEIYLLTLKPGVEGRGFGLTYVADVDAGPACPQPTTSSLGAAECDTDTEGGPWTVVQRRTAGDGFDRPWGHYKGGFGYPSGDHFLGLAALHELCPPAKPCKVRMEYTWPGSPYDATIPDRADDSYFSAYDGFSVGSESDKYRLSSNLVFDPASTGSDELQYHLGAAFSTFDRNNVAHSPTPCVLSQGGRGGWWYKWQRDRCFGGNLNGIWGFSDWTGFYGMIWQGVSGGSSVTSSRILVRPSVE